jgi:hypothetical protein
MFHFLIHVLGYLTLTGVVLAVGAAAIMGYIERRRPDPPR